MPRTELIGYLDKPNQRLLTGQDPWPVNGHSSPNGGDPQGLRERSQRVEPGPKGFPKPGFLLYTR